MNKFLILLLCLIIHSYLLAQKDNNKDTLLTSTTLSELKFRSIGPAFMSGRIADIAIHPEDQNTWYVAAGSGGVWKTTNSGITWTAIFENQNSYSIGCLAIDQNNPHIIWVGSGENVGGRHVGFGDGIYKSEDGGQSWTNMGLIGTQHISKIIIHPDNSDILWVAAQGPLWNKGGERGLYKTYDGGKNWIKTLGDDEWTGVTDILIDPRDPKRLYAATWQRHRNIAAYMGGGPLSGIHLSTDGGDNWERINMGLPTGNIGKIGLCISPQNPDVLYAAIELNTRTGAVYRSENRGASWEKMSETVSGATGPHYYQELYASPHQFDMIYLMDVRVQYSDNGGKKFTRLKEKFKHSDNHAMAFRENDPDYILLGTDGGLYESFDNGENWRFIQNLPLTQFYKIALDNSYPFYNIYGGTQDNGSQCGPSHSDHNLGIMNRDWKIVLSGDGHQPAVDPSNNNIVYAQSQEGYLHRLDRENGEQLFIQPQPLEGESYERYNWDAPVLISPHDPQTIYFASQRLWKSTDRGDSWTPISNDLTYHQERMDLDIMGQSWSYEACWDVNAMSNYNTIANFDESPLLEGLIYVGTDDGLFHITQDGGENWTSTELSKLPGVPKTAYVNHVYADLHNENKVYILLDNHKYGDFKPYILKSEDQGQTWQSIASNLPDNTILWRMVQDHINPELIFLGTEFGVYFSQNGGEQWIKLSSGLPTIPVRDIKIQKRENDLVAATFGRGIYILDDYSPLRSISEKSLEEESILFTPRDGLWYFPELRVNYSRGASTFSAENPPFGITFTYYLKESHQSLKEERIEIEKQFQSEGKEPGFPGWEQLAKEEIDLGSHIQIVITNDDDKIVRRINVPSEKGLHRISWDLKYYSRQSIDPDRLNPEATSGFMVAPGQYTATLFKVEAGQSEKFSEPVTFSILPMKKGALVGSEPDAVSEFWQELDSFYGSISALSDALDNSLLKINAMQLASQNMETAIEDMDSKLHNIEVELLQFKLKIYGSSHKKQIGAKKEPSIWTRYMAVYAGVARSTYGPTPLHQQSYSIAKSEFEIFRVRLEEIRQIELPAIEQDLIDHGAPWIEGQEIPLSD